MTTPVQNESKPTLNKSLSVFDGITILVGITIGAGIFSAPQVIAGLMDSFSSIFWLWILVGVFIFIGGLIYAELGTRLPETGGEYVYIKRAFGPFAGFIFGWSQFIIIRTSPLAGLAIVTVNYLSYFIELTGFARTVVSLAIIAMIGSLNYIGIHRASIYQRLSTVIKVGGLFFLVVVGLILGFDRESLLGTTATPTGTLGPIGNTVAALMMVVFAFTGFERVGYSAGEMKNPMRTIPLTMFFGITLIVVIYVLANLLYHQTLGMEGVRNSTIVASDVATLLLGPIGAGFIALIVMVSTTGSMNGTFMTATRVYYAMARDGIFFKWLDHIHPTYRTPSRAIIVHCIWGAVILLVRGSFEDIMAGMVFAVLIFYAANAIALFKFRREGIGVEGGYRMPLYPVLPAIYFIGIAILVILRAIFEWQNSLADLAFIASGLPFWLIWRKRPKP
jgi:amino acid transporter